MQTLDILERLIAFPTVSRTPNRQLIAFVTSLLDAANISWTCIESPDGTRANLFATVGPNDQGGVLLSGHTDVVPVEGQAWQSDPFSMVSKDGKLYGRGCADMKGFLASALSAALRASRLELATPLHLAFSYDEEIGCVGVRSLIEYLKARTPKPRMCIVGEPTGMGIAVGHKGKTALRAVCTGRAGHSAMAPLSLNALHLGADFLSGIRALQAKLANSGLFEDGYEVTYSTLHVGKMSGGKALNIVPDKCELDFEIRNIAADDPNKLIAALNEEAERLVAPFQTKFPQASIEIEQYNSYPGLSTNPDAEIVRLLRDVTNYREDTFKVAFGTEAGLFDQRLGLPTAVCGPGFMAQGHKPDEYLAINQLEQCDRMMDRLLARLVQGV